jgi:D-inositol-3-phosphate glycosyltransferase
VQVGEAAGPLGANPAGEAQQLGDLHGAPAGKVSVVPPGVDLEQFRPPAPGERDRERAELGIAPDAQLLLFVGRIQPLKAPDVLLRAVARLLTDRPHLRSTLVVAVVGGPSGSGLRKPESLQRLAKRLDIEDVVRFERPQPADRLAAWYRSADLVAVPSYSESFGLVALEAQACGTPVVAAAVGGLHETVADGVSGLLVDGHDPVRWGREIGSLLDDPERRSLLAKGAVEHAATFGWDRTVDRLLTVYREARWSQAGPPALRLAQ